MDETPITDEELEHWGRTVSGIGAEDTRRLVAEAQRHRLHRRACDGVALPSDEVLPPPSHSEPESTHELTAERDDLQTRVRELEEAAHTHEFPNGDGTVANISCAEFHRYVEDHSWYAKWQAAEAEVERLREYADGLKVGARGLRERNAELERRQKANVAALLAQPPQGEEGNDE